MTLHYCNDSNVGVGSFLKLDNQMRVKFTSAADACKPQCAIRPTVLID